MDAGIEPDARRGPQSRRVRRARHRRGLLGRGRPRAGGRALAAHGRRGRVDAGRHGRRPRHGPRDSSPSSCRACSRRLGRQRQRPRPGRHLGHATRASSAATAALTAAGARRDRAAQGRRAVPLPAHGARRATRSPRSSRPRDFSDARVPGRPEHRPDAHDATRNASSERLQRRSPRRCAGPRRWTRCVPRASRSLVEAGPGAVLTGLARSVEGLEALSVEDAGIETILEEVDCERTARGQGRTRHRRVARHRCRDRARAWPPRARPSRSTTPGSADAARRRSWPRSRRPAAARGRPGRRRRLRRVRGARVDAVVEALGAPRHRRQQRRHHARRSARPHERRRLERGHRHEPDRRVLRHPRRAQGHDEGAQRVDRQHRLGRRARRQRRPGQLRGGQGRRHRAHEVGRARARFAQRARATRSPRASSRPT